MNDFLRRLKLSRSIVRDNGGVFRSKRADHNKPPLGGLTAVFDQYEEGLPCAQNAVDLLPGWSMALPDAHGVRAGILHLHNDERMIWACERFGPLDAARVLELGPLEAGHTIYLERMGAAVLGIEANRIAYLKRLIVKEIVGLTRARFLLGDFLKWMESTEETYDFVVASGVLYHMRDPLKLLELMAKRSRAVYLWTHFVSDEAMPVGDPRRQVLSREPEIVEFHGMPMRLYCRTYANAQQDSAFSGGMLDHHRWMHRDDILSALRLLGLTEIEVAHEQAGHQNGPCFSVFARAPSGDA